MKLKEYTDNLPRGGSVKLARSLGISRSYLSQMVNGKTTISPENAIAIESATFGVVTRKDTRPDDWERIWPEYGSKSSTDPIKPSTRIPLQKTKD